MHLSLFMQKGLLILQPDTELPWQSSATFGWIHCRQQWKVELKEKLNLVVLKLKLIGMFLTYQPLFLCWPIQNRIPILIWGRIWTLFPSLPRTMCDSWVPHTGSVTLCYIGTNLNFKVSVGDWSPQTFSVWKLVEWFSFLLLFSFSPPSFFLHCTWFFIVFNLLRGDLGYYIFYKHFKMLLFERQKKIAMKCLVFHTNIITKRSAPNRGIVFETLWQIFLGTDLTRIYNDFSIDASNKGWLETYVFVSFVFFWGGGNPNWYSCLIFSPKCLQEIVFLVDLPRSLHVPLLNLSSTT